MRDPSIRKCAELLLQAAEQLGKVAQGFGDTQPGPAESDASAAARRETYRHRADGLARAYPGAARCDEILYDFENQFQVVEDLAQATSEAIERMPPEYGAGGLITLLDLLTREVSAMKVKRQEAERAIRWMVYPSPAAGVAA